VSLLLVRHAEVAKYWRSRCYGQTDVGLSRAGRARTRDLVEELARQPITRIVHSDLARTRALAEPLARRLGIESVADPRWRERDFGRWEGLSWAAIYRASGSAMDGMIEAPESFSPGGGETTYQLRDRVFDAWRDIQSHNAVTLVVSHGGPIAALMASAKGLPPREWPRYIPAFGTIVRLAINGPGMPAMGSFNRA
jgi:broad specificity phosphatase PhoE